LDAGVPKPSKGESPPDVRRIDGLAPHRIVAAGIAKTHQIPRPFLSMTGRENVAVAALYGSNKTRDLPEAMETAGRVLGLVGLAGKEDVAAANLTVQQRKRLEFARVLATGARILLLDEIFAGLSPDDLRDAVALFARLQGKLGFGALVVEHVMRAVLTGSQHAGVGRDGSKIAR